jgi:hypothetical protein
VITKCEALSSNPSITKKILRNLPLHDFMRAPNPTAIFWRSPYPYKLGKQIGTAFGRRLSSFQSDIKEISFCEEGWDCL